MTINPEPTHTTTTGDLDYEAGDRVLVEAEVGSDGVLRIRAKGSGGAWTMSQDAVKIHGTVDELKRCLHELERAHTWRGVMALVDEHYPVETFPVEDDHPDRDSGPRILSLIRHLDRLRTERDNHAAEVERLRVQASNYAHDRDEARQERDKVQQRFEAAWDATGALLFTKPDTFAAVEYETSGSQVDCGGAGVDSEAVGGVGVSGDEPWYAASERTWKERRIAEARRDHELVQRRQEADKRKAAEQRRHNPDGDNPTAEAGNG